MQSINFNEIVAAAVKIAVDYAYTEICKFDEQVISKEFNIPLEDLKKDLDDIIASKIKIIYKTNKKEKTQKEQKTCAFEVEVDGVKAKCNDPVATPRSKYCEHHKGKRACKSKAPKEPKVCKSENCDKTVATPRSLYCEEHKKKRAPKGEKVVKAPKVCKKDACGNPVATPRSLYCLEHKPKPKQAKKKEEKKEKEEKKCGQDGCDNPTATSRSKYCKDHQKKKNNGAKERIEKVLKKKKLGDTKPQKAKKEETQEETQEEKDAEKRRQMGPKSLAQSLVELYGTPEAVKEQNIGDLIKVGVPEPILSIAEAVVFQQGEVLGLIPDEESTEEDYKNLPLSEVIGEKAPFKDLGDFQEILHPTKFVDEEICKFFRRLFNYLSV